MADSNWDSADLKGVATGGLINESVMQQIWDISNIPLPFTDMVPQDGDVGQEFHEWTQDRLAAPDITNAVIDGQDTTAIDDSKGGLRVGNHAQISVKVVQVSTRARDSDTIGRADELSYQVMERQKELRRDVEAIQLTGQASVADDGSAVAGKTGGFPAWLTSTTSRGATGADGGYAATTAGIVDAETAGNKRGLTETLVRDTTQAIWELGGDSTVMMSLPGIIRGFSEYLFTSSARIASLVSDQGAGSALTATGSVNVFVSDFGSVLKMVPNRIQQGYTAADTGTVGHVLFIDPTMVSMGYLHGYRTEPLAKTGLADKRQMIVDHMLIMKNEEAQGLIADVDATIAVIQ